MNTYEERMNELKAENKLLGEIIAKLTADRAELLVAAKNVSVVYAELQSALPAIANTCGFEIVMDAVKQAEAAITKVQE